MAAKIKSVSFNSDATCFAACSSSGVHIMATEPLTHLSTIDSSVLGSGVRRAEMLDCTNLVALLYDETSPDYAENVVRIWDNLKKQLILQFSFPDMVQAVRLLNPVFGVFMLVATRNRLYVYRLLPRPLRITEFDTAEMTPAKLAISQTLAETRFAFPIQHNADVNAASYRTVSPSLVGGNGRSAITIRVLETILQQFEARVAIANEPGSRVEIDEDVRHNATNQRDSALSVTVHHESRAPITIQAHRSAIAALALNRDGSLLASASLKGTLIRVFSVSTSRILHTFRRGFDESIHYALKFSNDSHFLASVAHKGTVHVFALDVSLTSALQQNPASIGGFLLDSPKSTASFQLVPDTEALIAFGLVPRTQLKPMKQASAQVADLQPLCIYSVLCDGTYHKHVLATDGRTCMREVYERFDELFSDDL